MNEQAKLIVRTLKKWHCPDHLRQDDAVDELIMKVYNEAMNDVSEFIDVMIEKNPQHSRVLQLLQMNMFPGMKIGDSTK